MEKIKNIIDQQELTNVQKQIMKGFVDRCTEKEIKYKESIDLIKSISKDKYINQIILDTESVKIYKINGATEFDIKYPFRIIFSRDETWIRVSSVADSFELALLIYLEHKCLGYNSRFSEFAVKMLGLK